MIQNHQMASANARAAAVKSLIAAHAEEWERIYGDAREAEGLDRKPQNKSLIEEVRRLRARIAELERHQ